MLEFVTENTYFSFVREEVPFTHVGIDTFQTRGDFINKY